MYIEYSPKFQRMYKKLPRATKERAEMCEVWFRTDPFDARLKTHKLSGKLRGYWAFSISYKYRIYFSFVDEQQVRFHAIGGHEIYK